MRTTRPAISAALRVVTFNDNSDTDDTAPEQLEFTLPEDLGELDDTELGELLTQAQDAFSELEEGDLTEETVEALTALADAADAIRTEQAARAEAAEAAAEAVASLRTRMDGAPAEAEAEADADADGDDDDDDDDDDADDDVAEATDDVTAETEQEPEAIAASSVTAARSGPIHISLTRSSRGPRRAPEAAPEGLSLVASSDLPGVGGGQAVSLQRAAEAFMERARTINPGQMKMTHSGGRRTVHAMSIGHVVKPVDPDLMIREDGSNLDEVLERATDPSRLPGGALTAASGWCAPSQNMYDLATELEDTEGLLSLPEVGVDRGGINHTLGPAFSDLFGQVGISWNYTEDDVEAGDYDGYGGGTKPCFTVDCSDFDDVRLEVDGICLKAGLLQRNAYPETIERTFRGALVAHELAQSLRKMEVIKAGSTAVTFADAFGTAAGVLSGIELQIEHMRQVAGRGSRAAVEVKVPTWARGAFRADLARRLGVDLIDVGDARIDSWFTQRGAVVQYVRGLQDLPAEGSTLTAWPVTMQALVYFPGTWVAGTNQVVRLENVFDSALVEQNMYTRLFTEEGWLVLQRQHDSRHLTLGICTDGAANAGVTVDCDGTVGS